VQLRQHRDFEQRFPTDGISRPIGDVKRFPAFDGLRAFAALAVVGVHTAFAAGFARDSGYAIYSSRLEIGVSVFFVISGFLLYRPFVVAHLAGRDAPSAIRFWIRRLFRIVPAYWLALTVIVYVLHDVPMPYGWTGALVHYSFLQIYFPSAAFFGIGQAWSLCTEISFYLFIPLYAMAIALRRKSGSAQLNRELVGLFALTAVSFGFRAWAFTRHWPCGANCYLHPAWPSLMQDWLPAYLDVFALGMLLAVVSAWHGAHDTEPRWLRHRAMPWMCWGLAAVAYWGVSHLGINTAPLYTATPQIQILKQTLYGMFAFLLVAPAVFGPQNEGAIRRLLRLAPVAWLGVVSYGIYLWHAAVISEVFKWTGKPEFGIPFGILFLSVVGLSTIVATISYLALEQPLLEFANRVTRKRAADASGPSGVAASVAPGPPKVFGTLTTAFSFRTGRRAMAALTQRWRSWCDSLGVRWFLPGLLAIVVLAIGVRVGFAVGWTFGRPLVGDAAFYHQTGASIAAGQGYSFPSLIPPHKLLPTAQHPPLFSMVLAAFDRIGVRSDDAQRILLGVVASAGVFLMGLLGRRVASPAVGLLAAGIAAVSPLWFQTSAALMSESAYLVVIPAVLLFALYCLDRPTRWRFVALGGTIGLAALIRSDALGLVVCMGLPLVLFATSTGRQRLALARCLLAGVALVIAPWLIRNEVQMGGPALSDNQGSTLAGAYCPETANPHNYDYGGFSATCADGTIGFVLKRVPPPDHGGSWTELEVSNTVTSSTEAYIRGRLSALPGLVLARVENTWGLARTNQQVYVAAFEGRIPSFERFGLELGRVLLVFELIGAVALARKSWSRFFVLVAPLIAVTLNSAIFFGTTRFEVAALPSLAVLAAMGVTALADLVTRRRPRDPLPRGRHAPHKELVLAGADVSDLPVEAPSVAADHPGA
jgi:peptidoglycan/LPS O-acetylase OafA/YrhL